MSDTLTTPPDQRTQPGFSEPGDSEKFAHYVDKDELMEATINGTPLVALCGKRWVPTRDAKKFPVCPECKDLWQSLQHD